MKGLMKIFIIMSCLLFVQNCRTTSPVQLKEGKDHQASLVIEGSSRDLVHTDSDDPGEDYKKTFTLDEDSFINSLRENSNSVSRIEGIWVNKENTLKIGIQKDTGKDTYFAFILDSQEPALKRGDMIAEFVKTRYEHIFTTEYYLEDTTTLDTKSYVDEQGKLLIFLIGQEKDSLIFFREFPANDTAE